MSAHASPEQVRSRLSHPIIDGDGHWIEYGPVFAERMRKVAGDKSADGFLASQHRIPETLGLSIAERQRRGVAMEGYWGRQTTNTRDRATAMMPRMLYDRLDELGIDFGIVYPTAGLGIPRIADDETRRAVIRGFNIVTARVFQGSRRPADPGRGDPDAHAGGGDRGARIRDQGARLEGRHVRQRRRPPIKHRRGRRPGARPVHGQLRPARHRQPTRLRRRLAEMPRAADRADLPHRRPRLWPAQFAVELHLQPYRPLRRRRSQRRQGVVPRRRHAALPRSALCAFSKAGSAGAASCSAT